MTWFQKCHGENCDVRDRCRRYTEPASSVFLQPWVEPDQPGVNCPKMLTVVEEEDGA